MRCQLLSYKDVLRSRRSFARITQFWQREREKEKFVMFNETPSITFSCDIDDPINFRTASRQCFTNVAREFMDPVDRKISSFIVFSNDLFEAKHQLRCYRGIYCWRPSPVPLTHSLSFSQWCVYLFVSLRWRSFRSLDLSRWRLRFHFRPQLVMGLSKLLQCFRFTCPQ